MTECTHTIYFMVSLLCFYIMGLVRKGVLLVWVFSSWGVANVTTVTWCLNCYYDIYQDTFGT